MQYSILLSAPGTPDPVQCFGSGMFITNPRYQIPILSIPDPESRIQQQQQVEKGGRKLVSYLFC